MKDQKPGRGPDLKDSCDTLLASRLGGVLILAVTVSVTGCRPATSRPSAVKEPCLSLADTGQRALLAAALDFSDAVRIEPWIQEDDQARIREHVERLMTDLRTVRLAQVPQCAFGQIGAVETAMENEIAWFDPYGYALRLLANAGAGSKAETKEGRISREESQREKQTLDRNVHGEVHRLRLLFFGKQ